MSCLQFGAIAHAKELTSINVPMTQWTLLKSKVTEQELVLTQLEEKLKLLKTPSTELVAQLAKAKEELKLSKEALAEAKNSLQEAEGSILKLQNSLEKLKQEIDKERKAQNRRLWQNRAWSLLVGLGVGVIVKN